MKVKVGDLVTCDFGTGPVVAMSEEWCVILTNRKATKNRESAVPWDEVCVVAEADGAQSSIQEKDLP